MKWSPRTWNETSRLRDALKCAAGLTNDTVEFRRMCNGIDRVLTALDLPEVERNDLILSDGECMLLSALRVLRRA